MHAHRLIAALALTTGLAAPAALTAIPATATTTSCVITLYDIDAGNVAERDGKDELRFKVDGNLFPKFSANYYSMKTGGDGDPADFEHPSTLLVGSEDVKFDLREVTPPVVGEGDSLGVATAHGSVCAGLAVGASTTETKIITGHDETDYTYTVKLKLVRQ
ncbi:MAG: hypothetical protein HOV96_06695 [Nonomuraea sp.]|nr:hypothetical protein [Nonomuraea sp.]NUP63158.1 hypothetical protein [Nonomuraea sp.]NUP77221.1 hypothetical protein [Nonomuraea sp.]NUS07420.1 hypothetical protein [Nonomuraea sp.]NUT42626.1 hypothetical protein [Thermoactinospora sp.]